MPPQPPPLDHIRAGVVELVLDIARASVTDGQSNTLLRRVCRELVELCGFAGCAAGVLDGTTGSLRHLIGSHPEAEQLTRLARQLSDASGLSALRSRPIVTAQNLTGERTVLAEAAGKVGLPVTASITLPGLDEPVGFLQLFATTEQALAEPVLRELAPLAAVLGMTLHDAAAYEYSAGLVDQLSEALEAQRPIEQAKGLLAERHGIDLAAAYRMLREQARRRNIPVNAVAAEVVAESWQKATEKAGADRSPTERAESRKTDARRADAAKAQQPSHIGGREQSSGDSSESGDLTDPGTAPLPAQRREPTEGAEVERHTLF
ncbi:MAG TPA: GAF and ANTAR domain-containing protein [Pseudonocardia sp.]|nr:GAF and ANTAR domain-containing protein [Pseudonocardia sp.]